MVLIVALAAQAVVEAVEVAQMPKQAVSLNSRPRSLPSQQAETEVLRGRSALTLDLAVLPHYRAAALARQFLAVRQTAALSPYRVPRLVVTAALAHKAVPADLLA